MTALQELKEHLDENRFWDASLVFGKIEELLEKEKQQISDAFDFGVRYGLSGDCFKTGVEYFKETYEQ